MWRFFSNLIDGASNTSTVETRQNISVPNIPLRQITSEKPLDLLWSKVANLSNTEHRFLHPTYSPSSRVPCADFTPFIIDRLRSHDIISIRQLMRAIIAGNPGLGCGPEWIDEPVNEISNIDINQYCRNKNLDFQLELKAIFILGTKEGSGREFWLADEKPLLFAFALCCHNTAWLDSFDQLREKANRFIRKMRRKKKDDPYTFWDDCQLFHSISIDEPPIMVSQVKDILSGLPMLSRLHLLSFCDRGSASLMRSTTYKLRNLGLNPIEVAPKLLASGICELTTDLEAVAEIFTKNDIISILDEKAIPYRKSWKKSQLLEVLGSHAPDFITQVAEQEKIVRIKPEFLSDLRSLREYAYAMQEQIKLLCFAGSKP